MNNSNYVTAFESNNLFCKLIRTSKTILHEDSYC